MELEIRYHRKDGQPHLARASFPGEPVVHVAVETLDHVTTKLTQSTYWARPNMLVQMGGDGDGVEQAIRAVVDEDRAQGYRWALGRTKRDRAAGAHFEVRLARAGAGAADVWIRFTDGAVYTLWAATREGLVRAAGDGAPFFYSPNLLLVRELDARLVRRAVTALGPDIGECGLPPAPP